MRGSIRHSKISAVAGGAAALWLLCAGQSARAGGSGDLAALQTGIADFCALFGFTCPKPSTLSQAVLELTGLSNLSPDAVRSGYAIPVGNYVDASNASRPPAITCLGSTSNPCPADPLNPFTLPIDASALSTLHPLAFIPANNNNGTATPTPLSNPNATIFLYAVAGLSGAAGNNSVPDKLLLFYEDLNRINPTFQPGQIAASISLPLTVLYDDGTTERAVPVTLQFKAPATNAKSCSASTIVGDFAGTGKTKQSITPPNIIGVECAVTFGATKLSPQPHATFELAVPLLITAATDPIVASYAAGINYAVFFQNDKSGTTPSGCPGSSCILGYTGPSGPNPQSIGIAPSAGSLGSATTTATYALCASLPTGNSQGSPPVPAVSAFYTIAGDGVVHLSAPLVPTAPISCNF